MDRSALVDLHSLQVDREAPDAQRIAQILAQLPDPQSFRVGNVAVQIEYADQGRPLGEVLAAYLTSLRRST